MKKKSILSFSTPELSIIIGTIFLIACAMLLQTGCGNGVKNWWEECDDGNRREGDGCSNLCLREYCGDGIINNGNEECDDGNTIDGDGCSSSCTIEGSTCPSLHMVIQARSENAGQVTVSTYNETIVIAVELRKWRTREVCLHVGHDPVAMTAEGNANTAAFPFSSGFKGKSVSKFRGVFTFSELGIKCNEDVYVSLHMEAIQIDPLSQTIKQDLAWATGSHAFPGGDGGSYSMFHVCC